MRDGSGDESKVLETRHLEVRVAHGFQDEKLSRDAFVEEIEVANECLGEPFRLISQSFSKLFEVPLLPAAGRYWPCPWLGAAER